MVNEIVCFKQQQFVEGIIRKIREEGDGWHIPQPIFIVGSSGAGKSTIISYLKLMLEKEIGACRHYVFDGKKFFCSQDIIGAIEVKKVVGKPALNESVFHPQEIILIDDLDYYFKRTSFDDQYKLRDYLNRESAPLLIATISSIGESLADYRAPFFEGIRIMYIPKLDEESILSKDIPVEIAERLSGLLKLLPPVVRSFKIASDIISLSDSKDEDTRALLDRMDQMYRRTFEAIPINSQKILTVLAWSESSMSLSELRESTGIQSGILSSYLRQLLKSGIVRKISPDLRGTPYEICDKLFKLWIESDI